ncbi:MAG: hypothetical protein OEY89_00390 [Gammaproteobacteria bacterium]|nr:hypothetical protein [Gammaproteobacteria bacterium]
MNTVRILDLNKCFTLIAIFGVLYIQPVNATEWWQNFEAQSGFSGFAPPAPFSDKSSNKEKKEWRSGSSFNEVNKERYAPVRTTEKNPWRPVKSSHYKQSFTSQRPWGKVPERKPPKTNNMKFHDQRFKEWSHKIDSSYHSNFSNSGSSLMHGNTPLPFMNTYRHPGAMYGSPLITPGIYRGGIGSPVAYGMYPPVFNPNSGLSNMPWRW